MQGEVAKITNKFSEEADKEVLKEDFVDNEFIQTNIIAVAKQFDFLPLSYKSELVKIKVAQNFNQKLLQERIAYSEKLIGLQKTSKALCDEWVTNFYPLYQKLESKLA